MKIKLLIGLLCLSISASAQLFSEKSKDIGFEHAFNDRSLMGGGAAFFDYENDGDDDFYVTGGANRDDLYRNNGDGTFTKLNGELIGLNITFQYNTMGVCTGDVDNDGDREIFVTTWERYAGADQPIARSLFFLNNGDGTFTEIGESAGITHEAFGMGAAFLDYDKDGFLDVYVMNHIEEAIFTYDMNGAIDGMAYSDYDKDGDLDMVVVVLDEFDHYSKFYVNEIENDNHYVQFKLIGKETNRDAYGSKIWLYGGGQTFVKELYGGGASHASQHTSLMHFGLGDIAVVDSIRIDWTNGHVDHLGPFDVDQIHTIEEGIATSVEDYVQADQLSIDVLPNPFKTQITLNANQLIAGEARIQLISVTGSVVFDQTMSLGESTILPIDQNLPLGLYTLSIRSEEGSFIQKMVKL